MPAHLAGIRTHRMGKVEILQKHKALLGNEEIEVI